MFFNDSQSLANKKEILLAYSIDKFIFNLMSLEIWLRSINKEKEIMCNPKFNKIQEQILVK